MFLVIFVWKTKTQMKKRILLLSALLSIGALQAQNFTGRAYYKTATGLDFEMDSTQVSAEQQGQIMEMVRKSLQKEYVLTFDRNTSLYKEVENNQLY